ncbi:expressed unknown protein [Seminavis robusta]|uniref:Uncharacterized protein n=1 Tax=Seminavis robusta TaxID=568900 RepID=A0A9N8DIL2_9STRA|nr:expressed unknown protein [Seminavis robusta]|eukprot:Sro108_g054190.1 n/a (150) ;mRNA; f:57271-57720
MKLESNDEMAEMLPHTSCDNSSSSSTTEANSIVETVIDNIDECEWVDDAVLSITTAFGLCHTHEYIDRQVEYEQALQKCQRGREMANQSNMAVTFRHLRSGMSLASSEDEDDDESDLMMLRINSSQSLMDGVFLDELGMEVQLQALYSY